MRELGRTNRKDKISETVITYWLRLWETDESNPIGDTLRYQLERTENNWLPRIKKELQ